MRACEEGCELTFLLAASAGFALSVRGEAKAGSKRRYETALLLAASAGSVRLARGEAKALARRVVVAN